jgi:hypothetical protein
VASAPLAEVRAARSRATLALAIREGARKRRMRRVTRALGSVGALAAAALLGWLAIERSDDTGIELVSGSAVVLGAQGPKPVDAELAAGDRIEAGSAGARLELGSMTEVALTQRAVLAVAEIEASAQRLVLSHGHASFEVDPDRKGRVIVDTPDAQISVVGTYFHVDAEREPSGSWTSVRVERGLVEVRSAGHSVLLHPGESWSSRHELALGRNQAPGLRSASPAQVNTPSEQGEAVDLDANDVGAGARADAGSGLGVTEGLPGDDLSGDGLSGERGGQLGHGVPVPSGSPRPGRHAQVSGAQASGMQASGSPGSRAGELGSLGITSLGKLDARGAEPAAVPQGQAEQVATTLAEEISLYRSALSARNAGDDARAVERLAAFAVKYPRSTLRQEASVEHFRALRRLGRTAEAARAAARYLSAYPAGFARAEASELALPAR